MTRYFYYLIVMNMFINTIIFVPNSLIDHSHSGAVAGLLISTFIGTALAYLFTNAMRRYKDKTLPDILALTCPRWIACPTLIYLGIMWFLAGNIVIVTYALILKSFILPELSLPMLVLFLSAAVCYCAYKPKQSVLYLLELTLIINVPLIIIILFKALTNEYMNWYAIWNIASDYALQWPDMDVISAATYIFTGYINLVIFNKESFGTRRRGYFWILPLLGFGVLMTTFFIPIGFHGTAGVENYVYSWVSTADSMRMKFGFVDRVIYPFLLLFLSLTLIFVTVSWHVGYQLLKDSVFTPRSSASKKTVDGVIWGIFVLLALGLSQISNESALLKFALGWLNVRFYSEVCLVLFVCYLVRRGKRI